MKNLGLDITDLRYFTDEETGIPNAAINIKDASASSKGDLLRKLYFLTGEEKIIWKSSKGELKSDVKILLDTMRKKKQVIIIEYIQT